MNIYKLIRPIIFLLPAESAHNIAIKFLKFFPRLINLFCDTKEYDYLKQNICGLEFKNPIGLAAGFDKNCEAFNSLKSFGFGFVEAGTVTPKPQIGNPKPRIFRLAQDQAIINSLGFNNLGLKKFVKNFKASKDQKVILGANIGKNKDTKDDFLDYEKSLNELYETASYITLNISSPNTKNLRNIQSQDNLDNFLSKIMNLKSQLQEKTNKNTPIFLKIAPDIDTKEQQAIAKLALKYKIDALLISNTTINKDLIKYEHKYKKYNGGLSGKPLFDKSTELIKNFYQLTQGQIPLIAVGGIASAQDAYEKIKNGACLVQIYSAFIFEGFALVEKIKKELNALLIQDGHINVSYAIGKNLKKPN